MRKRRLCIITGSRADWGLFYPLAKEIKDERGIFILQIVAGGAHMSARYGLTYTEIEKDGFKISRKIKTLLPGDTEEMIAKSVSKGIAKFTDVLKELKPDLIFLLGDRFETLSAAIASLFLKIPIAHIHGGELTEASIDDSIRHTITKLSFLHFVSTEVYRKRVIQMGENPSRVFKVGALGLDNINNTKLLERNTLERRLNFNLGTKNILVAFSPSTIEKRSVTQDQFRNLLDAIDDLDDVKVIFTRPNPDLYSDSIGKLIDRYIAKNSNKAISFTSLGRVLYLSCLRFMDVVVGNSSSAIIEAPSFKIPSINIGRRQVGRLMPISVINVDGNRVSIKRAFRKALSEEFRNFVCKNVRNPYGDGYAAKRIVKIIKGIDFQHTIKKFYDIKDYMDYH